MLIQLAAHRDVSPYSVRAGIRFTEEVLLTRLSDDRPELILRIKNVRPFGETFYRGFSVGETLIPSSLNVTMSLVELPDSTPLRMHKMEGLITQQLLQGYRSREIPFIDDERFAVVFSDYLPVYDSLSWQGFHDMIQLINDYYAASALIDTLLSAAEHYSPLTETDIPEKYILLLEYQKIIALLESKQFPSRLNLIENDPERFLPKMQNLIRFTRSAAMTLIQQIPEMKNGFDEKDVSSWSGFFVERLMTYINWSLLMNGIRGDIYREYLDKWFVLPAFQDDRQLFLSLLSGLFPENTPIQSAQRMSLEVWRSYTNMANTLISTNRYAEAVSLLSHASRFRTVNPWMPEVEDSTSLMQLAVKGIFLSYLGIAESCIDQDNLPMAQSFLAKAETFKREIGKQIDGDTLITRIFRKLYRHQLSECDELLADQHFHEAVDCYRRFSYEVSPDAAEFLAEHLKSQQIKAYKGLYRIEEEKVLASMRTRNTDSALVSFDRAAAASLLTGDDGEVNRSLERLASMMLPVQYQNLTDIGATQYYSYKLEEAFQTFSKARNIAEQIGMQPDSIFESMYRESYKHHMLNEISIATAMIWNDELEEARAYIQEIGSVIDLYNLEPDADLQKALENYNRKIDRKVCLDRHRAMEALMARAEQNVEMLQFDVAVRQLGEARQIALNDPGCSLSTTEVGALINKYLSAAFYQEKLKEANRLIALGSVAEALQKVEDNERFYHLKQLNLLQVPFQSLLDFIIESQRIPVYQEGMALFIRNHRWDDAWVCLIRLQQAGIDPRQVAEYQEELGKGLALRDSSGTQVRDPEDMVKGYTGGNRWFAKFAQSYLTQRRLISHSNP